MAAMELLSNDSCVTFFSTMTPERRDFKFTIGIGNVKFSRLSDEDETYTQAQSVRLKRPQRYDQDMPMKVEEGASIGGISNFNQFSMPPGGAYNEETHLTTGKNKKKGRGALIDDEISVQ